MNLKRKIKNIINENLFPDTLRCSKEGIWTFKRSYFYRHGQSHTKLADKLIKLIPNIEIIDSKDCWRPWPKDSYFQIKFKVKEEV